jgi:arabinofuranosyltransferase
MLEFITSLRGQQALAFAVIAGVFVAWSAGFIWHSSFVAIDGQRYFSLVDDAMISMRYAWNLSHGLGLVWNAGQPVEGYTNLLMVLLMSAVTSSFHRSAAALVIQLIGIPTMLLTAFLASAIFRSLAAASPMTESKPGEALVFAAVLAYYPLVFWCLLGMETGLLALFLSGAILCSLLAMKRGDLRLNAASFVLLGLAFVTRNDTLVFLPVLIAQIYVYARDRQDRLWWYGAAITVIIFVGLQEAFRRYYYGSWVPNTYVLKLVGMPLVDRVRNGLGFIAPFTIESSVLLVVSLATTIRYSLRGAYFLVAFMLAAILYQVAVGGDAWARWRMLAPVVPLLMVAFVLGCLQLCRAELRRFAVPTQAVAAGILLLVAILPVDSRWSPEIFLRARPGSDTTGIDQINDAIAINAVTKSTASVGVLYAGIVPYYTNRLAIDFLGKSDPHIAALQPDLSGRISGRGMYSIPGHNKYDLTYSIQELLPTYVDRFGWGSQDLSEWSRAHYITVRYKSIRLNLLRGSPDVYWDRVRYLHPEDVPESAASHR